MIYFTAHTFKCVCHCRKAMFRVLGMDNFALLHKPVTGQELFFCLSYFKPALVLGMYIKVCKKGSLGPWSRVIVYCRSVRMLLVIPLCIRP